VIIRLKDRSAIITCNVESSTLQSNVVHWYRVQPGGAFQRLIYFEAGAKTHTIDPEAPRNFAGSVRNQQVTITIPKVHLKDEGWYFCALWNDNNTVLTIRGNRYKNLLYKNSSSKGETFRIF